MTVPPDTGAPGHRRGSAEFTRLLIAMFCAGVATFAQLYAPQPVLPAISADLGVAPADAALLVSAGTGGLAISVMGWSWAADRYGRVRTMTTAILAATLIGATVAWLPHFGAMVAARFVEGAALGGVAGVAMAYITEESHPSSVAAASGLYISGTSLGGLSGRLISGPVTDLSGDWRIGFSAVIAVSVLAMVAFIALAPAPRRFTAGRTTLGQVSRVALAHLGDRRMLAVFAQGFGLMGAFVTIYNYLGFRLEAPPFLLSPTLVSLLFVSYLAGTWSSSFATRLAGGRGRLPVLFGCGATMMVGIALTWIPHVVVIITGLVVLTAAFFGGHAIASGLSGILPTTGRAQATALYNFAYYAGSSLLGWAGGLLFARGGWWLVSATCMGVVALTMVAARVGLADTAASGTGGTDPVE